MRTKLLRPWATFSEGIRNNFSRVSCIILNDHFAEQCSTSAYSFQRFRELVNHFCPPPGANVALKDDKGSKTSVCYFNQEIWTATVSVYIKSSLPVRVISQKDIHLKSWAPESAVFVSNVQVKSVYFEIN